MANIIGTNNEGITKVVAKGLDYDIAVMALEATGAEAWSDIGLLHLTIEVEAE